MKLRPTQLTALEASYAEWKAGCYRQLFQMPTGWGKTVFFSCLPEHHKIEGRVLIIVHTEELAQQAADKFRKWNKEWNVGVEMASSYATPMDRCVVASVQTLGRAGTKRLDAFDPKTFGLVVTDEAHHSTAESYCRIFEYFGLLADDGPGLDAAGLGDKGFHRPLLIGVTATPGRTDGVALAKVYQKLVYQYPLRQSIVDGWSVDMRGIKLTTRANLDNVKTIAGDFATGELEKEVNTIENNKMVVKGWIDSMWPRRTVCFCVDIQHAKDMALAFQANNIPAEAVWGNDPDRAAKLKAHRRGDLSVLCNCAVLTEGYDDPGLEGVIVARPTKSSTLFTQMAGRGARLPEGIDNIKEALANGVPVSKKDCIIMDAVGVTKKHSLVTLSSIFGMASNVDLHGQSAVDTVTKVEQAIQQNPNIDVSKLKDINDLKTLIEQVNLFEVKFPDELVKHTQLAWHAGPNGTYVLHIPNKEHKDEKVTIAEDLLGTFHVFGTINGFAFKEDGFDDLQRAVQFADLKVSTLGRDYIKLLRREGEKWHEDPMTGPQQRYLERLFKRYRKGDQVPINLTKGKAKNLIAHFVAQGMR